MKRNGTTIEGETAVPQAARQALTDLQRYLADEIAPMMATESAEVLLRLPVECGAAVIRTWLEAQLGAPSRKAAVSDYLYHAVRKFHHLAELGLVDRATMGRYVLALSRLVLGLCPANERDGLRLMFSRMAEVQATLSAPVRVLARERGSPEEEEAFRRAAAETEQVPETAAPPPAASPRLSLLMGRVEEIRGDVAKPPSESETHELLARLVTKAAVEARDGRQLDAALEQVRALGIETGLDRRIFSMLGRQLPGWGVESVTGGKDLDVAVGRLLQAMHKIVELAGTREEGVQRFSEMVYAAIEQFNEGHLAQAVAMFDLAERLIEEKKVDAELGRTVKLRAQSSVSLGPLRQFAAVPAKHGLLRKVLRFFPIFSPQSLLERLDGEPKREVRKLMLSLLEVYGPPCRPMVLERLGGYLAGSIPDRNGFYSRNVVFLLRRIPRAADDDQPRELALLAEFSRPERPFMVAKEAVGALANLTLPQAEAVLIERLGDFERAALAGDTDYTPEQLIEIFDRACAALARLGSREAIRAIVRHTRRQDPRLGDTTLRLELLAGCDLSDSPEAARELIDRLGRVLPSKLLGVVLGRARPEALSILRALSGTTDPGAGKLFEEVAQRYAGQDLGELAREVLARARPDAAIESAPVESMAGDIELFGLPALLQSLADAGQSGRLSVAERNGHERGGIVFRDGKIIRCEAGPLRGMEAVCQLIEKPRPGTFRFDKMGTNALPRPEVNLEVLPTILEAIRRHDEFQEDRALVPDGASLMPTGSRPTVPEGEDDRDLVKAVWTEAVRGTIPESCEGVVASDAYRVRRLYAHWVEGGALRRRPAA